MRQSARAQIAEQPLVDCPRSLPSQARADSVMRYLTEHDVAASRLEAAGYGEEKPVADNATEAGRTKNRRVEFKILDTKNKPSRE